MGKQKLTVSNHYHEVRRVCQFMRAGGSRADFDEDALFQIELACDEAVTNIIEHAYGGEGEGEIQASYEIKRDRFVMTLWDNGRSFDPAAVPPPPIPDQQPADLEQLKLGGLGLHFIRSIMDEVRFESHPKRGNKLTMVKKRPIS